MLARYNKPYSKLNYVYQAKISLPPQIHALFAVLIFFRLENQHIDLEANL